MSVDSQAVPPHSSLLALRGAAIPAAIAAHLDERAAILQYEGGFARPEAEARACLELCVHGCMYLFRCQP